MTVISELVDILQDAERNRGKPGIVYSIAMRCAALGLSSQDTLIIMRYLHFNDEKGIPIGGS